MIKAFLLPLFIAMSVATAAAQPERPLAEWNVESWNPESQAACGAFLVKAGYALSAFHQTNEVFQILYRGLALNTLSEMTDPDTNARAWAAPADTSDSGLAMKCLDLASHALRNDLIPRSIRDDASDRANAAFLRD